MTREEILDDEFVRAKPLGIRLCSVGLLKLAFKLELSILKKREGTEERAGDDMEWTAMCFLMDERHPLMAIQRAADEGRAFLDDGELRDYGFSLTPAFLVRVKAEIDRTNRAVEAASYIVEPKPGSRDGPVPVGKS